MGRIKREIKRIEKKNSRQVTFCKRRKGVFKKAKDLSILCEADVALVVFSDGGRLHEFSSTDRTDILQRYKSQVEVEKEVSEEVQDAVQDAEPSRYSSLRTTRELLQTIQRQLGETHVDCLSLTDLVHLENQLGTALIQIRSKKTEVMLEFVKGLQEKEKVLMEENKHLQDEIATMQDTRDENLMAKRVTLDLFK